MLVPGPLLVMTLPSTTTRVWTLLQADITVSEPLGHGNNADERKARAALKPSQVETVAIHL